MATNLYQVLTSQDEKRLAKNPISVRLPVHILSRIQALVDIHTTRNRNEILIELIKEGLSALEASMPPLGYDFEDVMDGNEEVRIKYPVGYTADYQRFTNQHYKKNEEELGNPHAKDIYNVKAERVK